MGIAISLSAELLKIDIVGVASAEELDVPDKPFPGSINLDSYNVSEVSISTSRMTK